MPQADTRVLPNMAWPVGYSAAVDRVGATAAPLLAGFAFTLIGLVIGNTLIVAQRNIALLILVSAALMLSNAVQMAFAARRYYVAPHDYVALLEIAKLEEQERSMSLRALRETYVGDLRKHKRYLDYTRLLYNTGIVLLLAGVCVVLIPPGRLSRIPDVRIAAAAVAGAGALIEFMFGLLFPALEALGRLLKAPAPQPPPAPAATPTAPPPTPAPQLTAAPQLTSAPQTTAAPQTAAAPGAATAADPSPSPPPPPPAPGAGTAPAGPSFEGNRMPPAIFVIALLWLLVLAAMFFLYIDSEPVRAALPARLGSKIPLAVIWFGALGGLLKSLTGIFAYSRRWNPSYSYWHVLKPAVGAITGAMGCVLLLVTIELATTGPTRTDPTIYEGVAFVFGFAEAAFRSLITQVTNVILKPGTSAAR